MSTENKRQMSNMLSLFYNNAAAFTKRDRDTNHELEVKFKPNLTKIDYKNVIQKLKSSGFTSTDEHGSYYLRAYSEFIDPNTGHARLSSSLRTEITGFRSIQDYCKMETLDTAVYVDKAPYVLERDANTGRTERLADVKFDDFKFVVSYRTERTLRKTDKRVQSTIDNWNKSKKSYRFMNRVHYRSPAFPVQVDISLVKSSPHSAYTLRESGVLEAAEKIEIEIEVVNDQIGLYTAYDTPEKVEAALKTVIQYVLAGLQGTNYPISYTEQSRVLGEYGAIIGLPSSKRINSGDFVGPSSMTLQTTHLTAASAINVLTDYMVTDKADGERHLLFVSKSGKIYLINTLMNVVFTGGKTANTELFGVLLDGEWIQHNKRGEYINVYAAFDIYTNTNGKDVRAQPFTGRLALLAPIVAALQTSPGMPMRIVSKEFVPFQKDAKEEPDLLLIFKACKHILDNVDNGLVEYNTDGLIFTPISLGVGADKAGEVGPMRKITWDRSFKWKPAEYNTIDFLVSTVKNTGGRDVITPIFEDGLSLTSSTSIKQYKTIELQVGYDESKHGFPNPCQDVLKDRLPEFSNGDDENEKYQRKRFVPTNPYDANAGLARIMLHADGNNVLQMMSEEGDVFDDETIVEFRYDEKREPGWRWVPLRVRYDKTAELRQGRPNYGNAYHVADSNWSSIHQPITKEMITSGFVTDVEVNVESDVYYTAGRGAKSVSRAMRDFHNLVVKRRIIAAASKRGDTLVDLACGKGGDFSKWTDAHISFVFGVDVSRDNIENPLDGACARFLKNRKTQKHVPYALFAQADSRQNLRDSAAFMTETGRRIGAAVFGQTPKSDAASLGEGVARQWGKATEGFNVTSCQFAIHYFAESVETFHSFLQNVTECTAIGGYFVGCGYDGHAVYNALNSKAQGESIGSVDKNGSGWEIVKQYGSERMFTDDESSLGMRIEVFQDSIGQMIPEWLVNYTYLTQVLEDYGFQLMDPSDAKSKGLPGSSAMFRDMFNYVSDEQRKAGKNNRLDIGRALDMGLAEKNVSFLNRYFVYKKVRHPVEMVRPKSTLKPKEPTPKEPTPKEPIMSKEPTPKEPTPKEPIMSKEPTPKEPTPKEPTPKEPTPKEPIMSKEPTQKPRLEPKVDARPDVIDNPGRCPPGYNVDRKDKTKCKKTKQKIVL